jgi:hypothetical protein
MADRLAVRSREHGHGHAAARFEERAREAAGRGDPAGPHGRGIGRLGGHRLTLWGSDLSRL